MLAVSIFLSVAYAALLIFYLYGWRTLPEWRIPRRGWEPTTRASVIIPARNEAANIETCLRSIVAGTYPANLLEIIVIDDHSEDATASVVMQFLKTSPATVRLLSLADFTSPDEVVFSHKKKALEVGIAHATGDLIVTTDADCIVPKDWLRLLVSVFEVKKEVKILAAPVAFHREKGLLQHFQSLDFLGLMGITGAGIRLGWQRMGNGANLAYPKSVFEAVGGFLGNENRASGDDMFLIQKVAKHWPDGVFFLKNPEAMVLTVAKSTWRDFLQQRLRWGTKNATLTEWPVRLALLTVFLFCWSILINSILAILSTSADAHFLAILLFQIFVKALFDFILLREMCRFFNREDLLRWFVPSFFLHTWYIPLVGTASLFFKKYNWKGRRLK
ncbi:MAG: glycosyltransferase [Saprospiraceae bacterium]